MWYLIFCDAVTIILFCAPFRLIKSWANRNLIISSLRSANDTHANDFPSCPSVVHRSADRKNYYRQSRERQNSNTLALLLSPLCIESLFRGGNGIIRTRSPFLATVGFLRPWKSNLSTLSYTFLNIQCNFLILIEKEKTTV